VGRVVRDGNPPFHARAGDGDVIQPLPE
jgi:hypothetical protein